jgi:hypothetical protein
MPSACHIVVEGGMPSINVVKGGVNDLVQQVKNTLIEYIPLTSWMSLVAPDVHLNFRTIDCRAIGNA